MKPTWKSYTGDIATWQIGHCTVIAELARTPPVAVVDGLHLSVPETRQLAEALVSAADWVEQRKGETADA